MGDSASTMIGDEDRGPKLPNTIGGAHSIAVVSAIFDGTSANLSEIQQWGHQVSSGGDNMYSTKAGPPSFWDSPIAAATRVSYVTGWNCCCGIPIESTYGFY